MSLLTCNVLGVFLFSFSWWNLKTFFEFNKTFMATVLVCLVVLGQIVLGQCNLLLGESWFPNLLLKNQQQ